MTGGDQEQAPMAARQGDGAVNCRPYAHHNHTHTANNNKSQTELANYDNIETDSKQLCNNDIDNDDINQDELLSEALLAVASAEEYAAKIIKLQQACLTPLKEDLADWLNKIMNMSSITKENFMDKLDNGVIICRLAKIISLWCEQQLATSNQANSDDYEELPQQATNFIPHNNFKVAPDVTNISPKSDTHQAIAKQSIPLNPHNNHKSSPKLSSSILNVYLQTNDTDPNQDVENCDLYQNCYRKNSTSVLATPCRKIQPRSAIFVNGSNGPSRSSSQSTNCLISSSTTSLNNGYASSSSNQFVSNLLRMEQTKIWEDARCRTFYARDNVCNFIKWSKEFGVNQSVLFESDDLVLHANTRQVVLCLLDVARIACVRHGFTEAPGLVKFEQEIDRELAAEKAAATKQYAQSSTGGYDVCSSLDGDKQQQNNETTANRKLSSLARNSRVGSLADATDDLIMRYCLHKEEEAAKKKAAAVAAEREAKLRAEEETARLKANVAESAIIFAKAANTEQAIETVLCPPLDDDQVDTTTSALGDVEIENQEVIEAPLPEADSFVPNAPNKHQYVDDPQTKQPLSSESMIQKNNINYDNRVDSLDSGEGRTESASTSHSRTPTSGTSLKTPLKASSIPVPIKRSNSNSSLISNQTSSIGTSELSSSRSSLLSGQDSSSTKRHVASDLDGKVMRIAKSYYGKAATKGVTRLSEGKYKIADRIVFVRLLKGHLVMVRIGGGWDTLENFLFRHKSDPSQVIDVDNLLPLETKMTFEKSPQLTPTIMNKFSKLPYYRRSSSASSTNLSTSNLSVSNHSPTSSSIASSTTTNSTANNTRTNHNLDHKDSIESTSSHHQSTTQNKQIPCLLIHRGQNPNSPQSVIKNHHNLSTSHNPNSRVQNNQVRTPNSNRYMHNRPLGSSRTPTASSTNLYPATLTTRLASTSIKSSVGSTKLNSTTNLYYSGGSAAKQDAFKKLGRSNDSLQASYQKHHMQQSVGGASGAYKGNFGARRKIEAHRGSTNGLLRQTNGVNA